MFEPRICEHSKTTEYDQISEPNKTSDVMVKLNPLKVLNLVNPVKLYSTTEAMLSN